MEEQNRSSEHKIFGKEEKSPTFDFVKQESLHILHVDASFLKTLDDGGEDRRSLSDCSPKFQRSRYSLTLKKHLLRFKAEKDKKRICGIELQKIFLRI